MFVYKRFKCFIYNTYIRIIMNRKLADHPDWATKFRRPGAELRLINGKYYLYEFKTVYDPARKRARKISGKILGRITEKDGFVESDKNKLRKKAVAAFQLTVGPTREYGFSQYILDHFQGSYYEIKRVFPELWQAIVLLAYCRLLYQSPIKNMPYHISHSWLYEHWQPGTMTDKRVSLLLRDLGRQREKAVSYMKAFIHEGEYLLADTTNILSKSSHIQLSKKGYNNKFDFEPQINTMYLYSTQSRMPVFYRLHAGNIKEVKAFKFTMKESGIQQAIIIGDKGFYSLENIEALKAEQLQYIIPVKRDNSLLDYSGIEDNTFKVKNNYFQHEKRFIWYEEITIAEESIGTLNKDKIFLFLDETLRLREETDYLQRIATHPEEYSRDGYLERKDRFGTIGLISNVSDKTPDEIYIAYKSRMAIEEMFDSLKNVIDADSTYMQNEDTLQGWMFINHIALQWYQQIYLLLKDKKLTSKYSVRDFLILLRDVRKVRINEQWYSAEITKAVAKLLDKIKYNT